MTDQPTIPQPEPDYQAALDTFAREARAAADVAFASARELNRYAKSLQAYADAVGNEAHALNTRGAGALLDRAMTHTEQVIKKENAHSNLQPTLDKLIASHQQLSRASQAWLQVRLLLQYKVKKGLEK